MAERIALKSGRCWSFAKDGKVQNALTSFGAIATSRGKNENMQQTGISTNVGTKFVTTLLVVWSWW